MFKILDFRSTLSGLKSKHYYYLWVLWVVHLISFISKMNAIYFLLHRVTNKQIGKIFLVSIISMPTIHVIVLWLWNKVKVKVIQSCPTVCDPMGYPVDGILQARILEWVAFPSPGDLPNPGIEPRSPTLQPASLPAGPPEKPGVDRLSLLQCIFPTQEFNWGLLHCRWILYQLSY